MFDKILIANRGEIACRIARTCHRLGIRTAAIYSEVEGSPLHAEMADEAVCLPESANPVAGYLDIRTVVNAARSVGAQAVHPGYGFLSENPDFARACAESDIVFIGPTADSISMMGGKREALRRLASSGVPVLPGTDTALDEQADVGAEAEAIGYPLMIKASAGGGGIGMQIVADSARLERALRRARSSARRSFGNDDVYLERFVTDARHIEVQIVADADGACSHLWERECSVQRRHQKVIEEAPSPSISQDTRERLIATAVRAAAGVGFLNVGTFEFLMDADDAFYFMEANTRLQVEHGVSEAITGVDIVERQLRIAAGLPVSADPPPPEGHAIECRIYAENPVTFIPSPGTLTEFTIPVIDGLRVDTGFREGDEVSSYFDPLIAKLIARSDTRSNTIALMSAVLEYTRISGVETNIPTLTAALRHPDFVRGRYNTDMLMSLP